MRRSLWLKILLGLFLFGVIAWLGLLYMTATPGASSTKIFAPPTDVVTKNTARALREDVTALSEKIGERHLGKAEALTQAGAYVENSLKALGYAVEKQKFTTRDGESVNIECEIRGRMRPEEIIIIGAHYDTFPGSPGADDNGSGVAALLQLARDFRGRYATRTIRFVAFAQEEPPYFWSQDMGSYVYAKRSRKRGENIIAMLSLETLGYYSDAAGSQKYPPPLSFFYPSQGNFVAFVGNLPSRKLLWRTLGAFRELSDFPSQGIATFGWIPGVGWSDHHSFWKFDYPALMVTDTAPFRNPHYHLTTDTPEKLDYDRLAVITQALGKVVNSLLNASI